MTIQLKRQSGVSLRKNTLACSVKQLDRHMCLKMLQKLLLSHTSDVHMSNMLFVNETERLLLHVLLQLFILLISPYFYIFFSFFNHSFCNTAVKPGIQTDPFGWQTMCTGVNSLPHTPQFDLKWAGRLLPNKLLETLANYLPFL